jgi:hypothetical protein
MNDPCRHAVVFIITPKKMFVKDLITKKHVFLEFSNKFLPFQAQNYFFLQIKIHGAKTP